MDIFNQTFQKIQIKRDLENHNFEEYTSLYKIEYPKLPVELLQALPHIFSNILNISIDEVQPKGCVGRIFLFDITPHKIQDPAFIYCNTDAIDMVDYNYVWGELAKQASINTEVSLELIDELISNVRFTPKLMVDEKAFLIFELLKFENVQIRRARHRHSSRPQ
jgi:hypothetical protein